MNKNRLLVLAIILVSIIAAGILIASAGIGTDTVAPPGAGNNPDAQGPRSFVVNVTDSIEVEDK